MANRSIIAGVNVGNGSPVRIMGVINVSPESFYKGSIENQKSIARAARRMEEEGADFIDVGAMSTAPYLVTRISEKEEAKRLERAVRIIRKNCRLPISIDTTRSQPAEAGLRAGARILNDVSGFRHDARMAELAKRAAGVILMAHPDGFVSRRLPDPISATKQLLVQSLKIAAAAGIPKDRIAVDPGIGFFRNFPTPWWQWDLEVIRRLDRLQSLGCPILVGLSRKSFIGRLTGGKPPEERLYGSLGGAIIAVVKGAGIIRTHDVLATKEAVRCAEAILKGGKSEV